MSLSPNTLALALAGTLCLSSCSGNGAGEIPSGAIAIAVGARVPLTLKEHGCESELLAGCLSELPQKIKSITVDDDEIFKLGESAIDLNEITLEVSALSEGDTTLVVKYEDFFGDSQSDEIQLYAKQITHVVPNVFCDRGLSGLPRYAITSGSEFLVELTAMGGETPLASGSMELIKDSAGFEVLGEAGEVRTIIAPSTPGNYSLDLIGSPDPEFAIYNPSDMEIRLSEEINAVKVERVLGDTPICKHDGLSRAFIEVTQGACFPLIGGYEIEGKLPVDMQAGDFSLMLSGKDTCQVSAGLDGGKILSLTLPVDDTLSPPTTGSGKPFGVMPTTLGGEALSHESCPIITNITNGSCEIINAAGYVVIPDADCFLDWSWVKDLYSADGQGFEPVGSGTLGQGLWAELHLGVLYEILFIDMGIYSTNNLKFSSTPASGIEIKSTGCIGSDREVLAIRPTASGNYTLSLNADNVYESSTFSLSAQPVNKVVYTTEASDVKIFGGGTQEWWFVGSRTKLELGYEGFGGKKLFGKGPLVFSSESAETDATTNGSSISMGTKPANLQLASPVASNVHFLHVVDESSIDGVGGLEPTKVLQIDQSFSPAECIEAYPMAAGARIHGDSPIRPRVSISGTSIVVDVQQFGFFDFCVWGYEGGSSTLKVSYGAASAETVFSAQP